MPNIIHRDTAAELIAVRMGIYAELLNRIAGEPRNPENVLSCSAILDGCFITVSKHHGKVTWLAVTGPGAQAAGLQLAAEMYERHRGPEETRTAEFKDVAPPQN